MQPPTDEQAGQILEALDAATALASCDMVNVLLTDHSGSRQQCLAIVPNYEFFQLHRWMRVDGMNKLDSSQPLTLHGRGLKSNGRDEFLPPKHMNAEKAVQVLTQYLAALDNVNRELKAILQRIHRDHTVIVMVCNFGQSELLLNFLCQAWARTFDIGNLLVFAMDQETHDMVADMGVAVYYDKRVGVHSSFVCCPSCCCFLLCSWSCLLLLGEKISTTCHNCNKNLTNVLLVCCCRFVVLYLLLCWFVHRTLATFPSKPPSGTAIATLPP